MKTYIISIITISVISGILSAALPSSEGSMKKQINFITGLICAIILLSPIVTIAKNAEILTNRIENAISSLDVKESIDQSNAIIIEEGTEQIAVGIKNALLNKYKFKDESVSVNVLVNDEIINCITLKEVTVTLKNEATWTDSFNIKEYLENLVGCPVKIKKI